MQISIDLPERIVTEVLRRYDYKVNDRNIKECIAVIEEDLEHRYSCTPEEEILEKLLEDCIEKHDLGFTLEPSVVGEIKELSQRLHGQIQHTDRVREELSSSEQQRLLNDLEAVKLMYFDRKED